MPVTRTQLVSSQAWEDAEGNVLADGYLEMQLNQDASVPSTALVCSGRTVRINLDSAGLVVTSPAQSVWANDVMLPSNTYYIVSGFTSAGQRVWGPNNEQVASGGTGGGTFDISSWAPAI